MAHATLASRRQCHYCEHRATTRDHIVPRALLRGTLPPYHHAHVRVGGVDVWNLVPACLRCNNLKSDKRSDCGCALCLLAWEKLAPDVLVEVRNVIELAALEDAS